MNGSPCMAAGCDAHADIPVVVGDDDTYCEVHLCRLHWRRCYDSGETVVLKPDANPRTVDKDW